MWYGLIYFLCLSIEYIYIVRPKYVYQEIQQVLVPLVVALCLSRQWVSAGFIWHVDRLGGDYWLRRLGGRCYMVVQRLRGWLAAATQHTMDTCRVLAWPR